MTSSPVPGLVSIGLPVRNGAAFIERSLASLLAQRYEPIEIIIGENASDDGTRPICERIAASDPRVRILRHQRPLDVTDNFASVLDEARGELFMFAAVDDVWSEDFVPSLVEALRSRPDALVAMSAVDHEWWDGRDPGSPLRFVGPHSTDVPGLRRALRQAGGSSPYFQFIYGLFRTPFLVQAWRRLPKTVSTDGLFAIQLALAGPWAYVDRPLTTRYVREKAWPERYQDDALARSIGHPMAELKLLGVAGPYLLRSTVIPLHRKLAVPLVLARLALWRLPILVSSRLRRNA